MRREPPGFETGEQAAQRAGVVRGAGMIGRRSSVAFVVGLVALAGCGSTTASSTGSSSPASSASSSVASSSASPANASSTAVGDCKYIDAATVQQDVGITIAIVTQVQGGCFLESATGSQDAQNAVKFLHGHDGVILGITPGTLQPSSTCQQTSIPGVPAPGAVCQQTTSSGVTLASFQLPGGRVGSLTIFAPALPSLSGVDQLAAAAYPNMLAG